MIIPTPGKPAPDQVKYRFSEEGKDDNKWIDLNGAHTFYNGAEKLLPVDNLEVLEIGTDQPLTITVVMGYKVPPNE
jgi:hypothetical protein